MSLTVRDLTAEDSELAAEFVARLIVELSPGYSPDLAALAETAQALLSGAMVTGFAAFEGERAVGLLMLNECAAIYAGGRFGEITEFYVLPEFRSRGVARRLVASAYDLAVRRGWRRLEVGAPDQPAWARTKAFYEREGFSEVGPRLKRAVAQV
ncbi:MAG: GNAT family N-acetyltransferase [Albidovulum sp.]